MLSEISILSYVSYPSRSIAAAGGSEVWFTEPLGAQSPCAWSLNNKGQVRGLQVPFLQRQRDLKS